MRVFMINFSQSVERYLRAGDKVLLGVTLYIMREKKETKVKENSMCPVVIATNSDTYQLLGETRKTMLRYHIFS